MVGGRLNLVLEHIRQLAGGHAVNEGSDAQLLERFASHREEAAFAALVQRHGAMVLSVCQRILPQQHEVEDAFQSTFLVLARKAGSIRKQASVGSWLYGVAYRVAMQSRKNGVKLRRRQERLDESMAQWEEPDNDRGELRMVLDEEVSRLPEKYRAPVILCWLEQRTNEEAARELGWPKGTVQGRLARARDLLRDRLTRRGVTVSAVALGAALSTDLARAALPATLADSTVKAATLFTGGTTAAAVSSPVAKLAEGVIRMMWWTKLTKLIAAFGATLGLVGVAAGLLLSRGDARGVPLDPPAPLKQPADPLELTLAAKRTTFTGLDHVKAIEDGRQRSATVHAGLVPRVDFELVFRNRSDKEIKFWVDGATSGATAIGLDLKGPGAENLPLPQPPPGGIAPPPVSITLAPGKTYTLPLDRLVTPGGNARYGTAYFWTKPGEYTLTARYRTALSPAPVGVKEATYKAYGPPNLIDSTVPKGFGEISLTSKALKFKVVEKE